MTCIFRYARFRVFSVHLGLSIVVLLGFWGVLNHWYPSGFLKLQGADVIWALMILVSMALGPLLTLLVFKRGKKTLLLDIVVVVLIQVATFSYGAWVLSTQRPAYLVFLHDRFFVVAQADLTAPVPDAVTKDEPWKGAVRVVAVKINLLDAMNMQSAIAAATEPPALALMPGLYRPFEDVGTQLSRLAAATDGDQVVTVPVVARAMKGIVRVDTKALEVLSVSVE